MTKIKVAAPYLISTGRPSSSSPYHCHNSDTRVANNEIPTRKRTGRLRPETTKQKNPVWVASGFGYTVRTVFFFQTGRQKSDDTPGASRKKCGSRDIFCFFALLLGPLAGAV
jgi:hypothetical protein